MVDLLTEVSLAINAVLAVAAISSAIVARQSTTRLIEEERTPVLDAIIKPAPMRTPGDNIHYWPVYIINLGKGAATEIVAESRGKFLAGSEVGKISKSFLLPMYLVKKEDEFSIASVRVPIDGSFESASFLVQYSDVPRSKRWQFGAEIQLGRGQIPSLRRQRQREISRKSW